MVNKTALLIFSMSASLMLIIMFPIKADAQTFSTSNNPKASEFTYTSDSQISTEAITAPDDFVSLSGLINEADNYDSRIIKFRGEAIGNILYRGSYAWVNVSDTNNSAIGIWMSADTARRISVLGCYGMRGDTLLVTGTFNRACPDHGGDPDIHADNVTIISPGGKTVIPVPSYLPYLAAAGVTCAVILCGFAFYRIRHYNN